MTLGINYPRLRDRVKSMLRRNGAPAQLLRVSQVSYDPASGAQTNAAPAQSDVYAVVFNFADGLAKGTNTVRGEKTAYVSVVGDAPQPGDQLAWQGQNLNILKVTDFSPAGTSMLFQLEVSNA